MAAVGAAAERDGYLRGLPAPHDALADERAGVALPLRGQAEGPLPQVLPRLARAAQALSGGPLHPARLPVPAPLRHRGRGREPVALDRCEGRLPQARRQDHLPLPRADLAVPLHPARTSLGARGVWHRVALLREEPVQVPKEAAEEDRAGRPCPGPQSRPRPRPRPCPDSDLPPSPSQLQIDVRDAGFFVVEALRLQTLA